MTDVRDAIAFILDSMTLEQFVAVPGAAWIAVMKPWPGRIAEQIGVLLPRPPERTLQEIEKIERRPVGALNRYLREKGGADYRRVARPAGCYLSKS